MADMRDRLTAYPGIHVRAGPVQATAYNMSGIGQLINLQASVLAVAGLSVLANAFMVFAL